MAIYTKNSDNSIELSNIQVGAYRDIPIYESTTTTKTGPTCNYANLSNYFTVTQGSSYGWTLSENTSSVKLVPKNIGVGSTTALVTFTATRAISNLIITGAYYTESSYDKITLTVGGVTKLSAVSGASALATRVSGVSLSEGETVVFQYSKDSSVNHSSESNTYFTLTCDPYTETVTENVIVGYENKLLPTNIIKAYSKISGNSTLLYPIIKEPVVSYSGSYENLSTNSAYIYLLKGTGTLTLSGSEMTVWLCGGGGAGGNSIEEKDPYYPGGGGGGGFFTTDTIPVGTYNIAIGAGGSPSAASGGTTTITGSGKTFSALGGKTGGTTSFAGGNGGSGGGEPATSSGITSAGTGQGISSIPPGFNDPFCAGGGAGSFTIRVSAWAQMKGGAGGTNGSSGGLAEQSSSSVSSLVPASGGNKGGGAGGTNRNGSAATYYGGGGGGGGIYRGTLDNFSGGSGYAGCVVLYWPKA